MSIGLVQNMSKKMPKSPQWLRNIKIKKQPFWKIFSEKQPQHKERGMAFQFLGLSQ